MSKQHPIIAVTGSSGAGTSMVSTAFEHIFYRKKVTPAIIAGDSFHRYDRKNMKIAVKEAQEKGHNISHFGPEANLFDKLEDLFAQYGEHGTGTHREYIHDEEEASNHKNVNPGEFTNWQEITPGTDLLFYEGLHGGLVNEDVDIAKHVDLLIGVVPIVNLEWIQKIHRDTADRGYTPEAVTRTILRRMEDYVYHITPQFSRTDINFQRVPTVDTSNPFIARDIPTPDESFIVIRFREPKKYDIDFLYLLNMIHDSFMSRPNTIVVPAGKMGFAMEVIISPILENMMLNGD
ncbi:MAG: phosphoribulokinase [Deltaproteobacteria bacterium]|nr:phosphoribulokinase [Deltaproteobacteria bacterium]